VALRLLDVREGEWPAVGPALGLAFLAVGAQTLSIIASDTLFVSAFDLGRLSGFYIVTALLRVAVSLGYGAVAERAPGVRAETGLLALTAASALLSGLTAPTAGKPLLYAVCALLQLLPTLLPLVAMNAAMDCFHARQAKRLLPLVAAAATIGAVVASGAAKLLAVRLGTGALLFVAAALALAALPLPALLAARALGAEPSPSLAPAKPADKPGFVASLAGGLADLGSVPVVRIFAANALLVAASVTFVDFAFKAALKARYGRDEMAAFQGSFILVTEALVLGAQLLLTSRFLGRFGVAVSLQARPVAMLALAPLAAASGVVPATALKFTEMSLRMALTGAVSDLLLAPTPARMRSRIKLFAKSAAMPVGSLLAGLLLGAFGAAGPSRPALALLVSVTAALSVAALFGVRRAYTKALAEALGEGRVTLDVSPAAAELLRTELRTQLQKAAAAGDVERTARLCSVMSDRLFHIEDLAPALAAGSQEAVRAALRLARPGEGAELLARLPPADDDALETEILAAARALGAAVDRARIDRAVARGKAAETAVAADLWAEGVSAWSALEKDAAVKQLRKAALGADGPRRAAAMRALGELREARAETEILRGLGSPDPAVYAEAARAAILIGASGAVPTLISNLEGGVQVRASMRALAQAGPAAVGALLSALPTTRGEGAFRTAVAGSRGMAGTVRAARVLMRLGPEACQRALDRFAELGFRARTALARALSTVPDATAQQLDRARVESAMALTLDYAETLTRAHAVTSAGLLRHELRHRIGETAHRLLDLASLLRSRALIARARAALDKDARDRGNALELLENVLPRGFAARTVALLEHGIDAAPSSPLRPAPSFDGWLLTCRKFDAGELRSDDPMLTVLDRLVVLREAPLFAGLSGEELYPVGEIAKPVDFAPAEVVVRQGDPGDALYVVAEGTLRVKKDDALLREIGPGAAFGEMALLDGAPRAATVEAVTSAKLLQIPRAEFEALLDESPEIARAVIRMLLGYVRGR
jgi:hypothetical protein